MRDFGRRVLGSVAGAAALLAIVAQGAIGVTPGDGVGVHDMVDTPEYPGVRCVYAADGDLVRMRVRPPVLFAQNTTPETDTESVQWFTLLEVDSGSGFIPETPVAHGDRTATDTHPAHYPEVVIPITQEPADQYRVRMRYIYDPFATPKLVQHYPTLYRAVHPTQPDHTMRSVCPGEYTFRRFDQGLDAGGAPQLQRLWRPLARRDVRRPDRRGTVRLQRRPDAHPGAAPGALCA
jgi:hypothetical protein